MLSLAPGLSQATFSAYITLYLLTSSRKGDLLAWCSVVCVSLYLHLGTLIIHVPTHLLHRAVWTLGVLSPHFLKLSAIFKSTPGRLTIHSASASSPLSGYSNPDRVNLKRRNTNQLEAASLNLIKTKRNHRGFEFGGPKPWNVSQTSNMQRQCCFIWFGVDYPLC